MTNNNLLRGLVIVLICLFGTYVFMFPPNSIPAPNGTPSGNDTIVAPVETSAVCMDYNQYHYSTLKTGLVRDMVEIYRKNQLRAIATSSTNPISNDAYSIWFDLDTIKKFIYHIERGVQQNGAANSKLGLRLYYAAYPDKSTWSNQNYEDLRGFLGNPETELYEKKHTLVVIPTINIGSPAANHDFNPFDKDTYVNGIQKPPVPENPEQGFDDPTRSDPIMALTASDNPNDPSAKDPSPVVARNHGTLIPPASNAGVGF